MRTLGRAVGIAEVSALIVLMAFARESAAGEDRTLEEFTRACRLFEDREFLGRPGSASLRYRFLSPENPEAGKQFPLVVFLHGAGNRGDDNTGQLRGFPEVMCRPDVRKQFPCFVLAPQCPSEQNWVVKIDELTGLVEQLVQTSPIDARRIYLTGFSMGGYGAWSWAASRPDLFAAVVPVSGGGDLKLAAQFANVPVWTFHGDRDRVIPVEISRRMVDSVRGTGGNVRFTELEGVGHSQAVASVYGVNGPMLPWMFSQRKAWLTIPADWTTRLLVVLDAIVVLSFAVAIARMRLRRSPKPHPASAAQRVD